RSGSVQNSKPTPSPAWCQAVAGISAGWPNGGFGTVKPFCPDAALRHNLPKAATIDLTGVRRPVCSCCDPNDSVGISPDRKARLAALLICLMYRRSLCEAQGSRQGRKLQTPTFRYKRVPRQACTSFCYDEVEHEMAARKMRFVLVNDTAPPATSVCSACSQPLRQGYLHDVSTSRRYCGIECYPQWLMASGFIESFATMTAFEFALAWPNLTVDVASALFDSAWADHLP